MSKVVPEQWRGFPPFPDPQTLDKPMNDRKHLVVAGVEKLLEAANSSRKTVRDRCLLLLMFGVGKQ
jgi:site-specific recombinase XerD